MCPALFLFLWGDIMWHVRPVIVAMALTITVATSSTIVCAQAIPASSGQTIPAENILDIEPDAKVDEQLFMVRRLEFLHAALPTSLEDQKQITVQLASLRHELVRGEEYAKTKRMDDLLITMYSDSIRLADEYAELLTDLGVLDRELYRKAVQQTANDITDSGVGGFVLGAGMAVSNIAPPVAAVVLVGWAVKKSVDVYLKEKRIENERKVAIERRMTQFLTARSRILARTEIQAGVLAEKFHWAPNEVGFDQDENEARRIRVAVEGKDYDFLLRYAEMLKLARPRDPFVHAASGELWAFLAAAKIDDGNDGAAIRMRTAAIGDYRRGAELVPAGKIHDQLRAGYLASAAENASLLLYHSQKRDELPLTLVNTAFKYLPRDPDGRLTHIKAFALARNGRYDDASTLIEKYGAIIGRDAQFHYDFACILSMAGNNDDAITHLKTAWEKGNRNVRGIKKDRDLAGVRIGKASAIAELLKPNWEGAIEYGVVWNDFVVKNKSDYPLNNVVVRATWKGADGTDYAEVYWAKSIAAGGSRTFQSAFDDASKSKESVKDRVVKLMSDESRTVQAGKIKDVLGGYMGIATLMRDDGYIKTTSKVRLDVADAGKNRLRFRMYDGGVAFAGVADDLRDGFAIVDGVDRFRVWFEGKIAYGLCQTASDAQNNDFHVFWLTNRR